MTRSGWRRRLGVAALLAPGIGFLILMFGYPLLAALAGSFGFANGAERLDGRAYARFLTSLTLQRGLLASLYYGLMPVITTLVPAIWLALTLRRSFIGRRLFNGLYKIPLAIPGVVAALLLLAVAERGGLLDRALASLGFALPALVRDPCGIGVIAVITWKQLPFMTLVITAAFSAIPEDVRLAARTLGASPVATFLRVELPLALPGIASAILLTFIASLGSFAVPDLIGPPIPAPLTVIMVKEFAMGDVSQVYAIGVVLGGLAAAGVLLTHGLTAAVRHTRNTGGHHG